MSLPSSASSTIGAVGELRSYLPSRRKPGLQIQRAPLIQTETIQNRMLCGSAGHGNPSQRAAILSATGHGPVI